MDVRDSSAAAEEETSRPLRKDAARNRALLVAAGREVFAERGLDASLDDVAHAAGVGVGTAYRHFANKYELARAIFAEAIDEVLALADRAGAMDDPWRGIVAFLEGVAARQTADRGLREVLMGAHDAQEMERVSNRISAPLQDLIARAKAAGSIGADVEATDIGVIVLMLCTVADATADVAADHWRRYLPMLLAGLRSGTGSVVPPLDEPTLRAALSTHKQRVLGGYAAR